MGKYNYDKKYLKGIGVGPFLKQVKVRNQHIEDASDELHEFKYDANRLVDELHPSIQPCKIIDIIERKDAKSFVFAPLKGELAYFRAGQYCVLDIKVGKNKYYRPYSISSSPKKALGPKSCYMITIKNNPDGLTSKEINAHWKVGDQVTLSGPTGEFYYQGLRDAKHIVGVAGGSGITPFIAMAEAIADNTENFKLTIVYGCKDADNVLFEKELDEITKKTNKVNVIYVFEDRDGFINADTIKKAAGQGDYSLFVCGPRGLYKAMDKAAEDLRLPLRRFRKEVFGEYGDPSNDKGFPAELKNKEFNLTVRCRGEEYKIKCNSNTSLLNSMEKAGIRCPSRCRSGECGWCHSLLISGNIYTPKSIDYRRIADKTFGYIHPCASYPLSDIVLEIPVNR